MKRKKRRRMKFSTDTIYVVIVYTVAIVTALLWLYPLIFVLSASFSDPQELLAGNVTLFPKGFTLDAYRYIFKNKNIMTGYRNTIFYSVVGTLYNMVLTVFAAYPLSKKNLRGRNVLTMFVTFTMFFGGGMIPTYLNLNSLHMLNTPWVMFIPSAISVTNFLIMRNYFIHSVPEELTEAAYMEGASQWQILRKIVLPLSGSILGVLTIYYMSGHWNAYFSALIYLSDDQLMPLQIFLRRILVLGSMDGMSSGNTISDQLIYESLKYGIIVVSTLPMLIAYLLVQKSFKKGIMMGSLKG